MVTVEFEVSDFSAFFKRFESIEKSSFLSEAGATAVFLGESRVGKGFFAKGVPVALRRRETLPGIKNDHAAYF